jgi:RimJ/RimL family protein N-acetyltransferase
LGTEARAALLHFAFAVLEADEAISGACESNAASLAVSKSLGHEQLGTSLETGPSGVPARIVTMRLSQEALGARTKAVSSSHRLGQLS